MSQNPKRLRSRVLSLQFYHTPDTITIYVSHLFDLLAAGSILYVDEVKLMPSVTAIKFGMIYINKIALNL